MLLGPSPQHRSGKVSTAARWLGVIVAALLTLALGSGHRQRPRPIINPPPPPCDTVPLLLPLSYTALGATQAALARVTADSSATDKCLTV